MKNPFLTGARVYLRALDRADAPVILPWVNDRVEILGARPEDDFIRTAVGAASTLTP